MSEAGWVLRVETDAGGAEIVVTPQEARAHGSPEACLQSLIPRLLQNYRASTGHEIHPSSRFVIRCVAADRLAAGAPPAGSSQS